MPLKTQKAHKNAPLLECSVSRYIKEINAASSLYDILLYCRRKAHVFRRPASALAALAVAAAP
jgi:hypothetical protein